MIVIDNTKNKVYNSRFLEVDVKTEDYTANTGELIPVDPVGKTITIELPTAKNGDEIVIVKAGPGKILVAMGYYTEVVNTFGIFTWLMGWRRINKEIDLDNILLGIDDDILVDTKTIVDFDKKLSGCDLIFDGDYNIRASVGLTTSGDNADLAEMRLCIMVNNELVTRAINLVHAFGTWDGPTICVETNLRLSSTDIVDIVFEQISRDGRKKTITNDSTVTWMSIRKL